MIAGLGTLLALGVPVAGYFLWSHHNTEANKRTAEELANRALAAEVRKAERQEEEEAEAKEEARKQREEQVRLQHERALREIEHKAVLEREKLALENRRLEQQRVAAEAQKAAVREEARQRREAEIEKAKIGAERDKQRMLAERDAETRRQERNRLRQEKETIDAYVKEKYPKLLHVMIHHPVIAQGDGGTGHLYWVQADRQMLVADAGGWKWEKKGFHYHCLMNGPNMLSWKEATGDYRTSKVFRIAGEVLETEEELPATAQKAAPAPSRGRRSGR
jgi:hypothetical protein